jgi:hypothetical protein
VGEAPCPVENARRFASRSRWLPRRALRDNLECASKVATVSSHDELEHIATRPTAETVEDFLFRMNVERWISFGMQRATSNVLLARFSQGRVSRDYVDKICLRFQFTGAQGGR